MSFVLGVDLGTSSVKSLLLNVETKETWIGQVAYQYDSPQPGFASQDVNLWWESFVRSVQIVLQKSGVEKNDIKALSFSGQMHGIVFLDKRKEPIYPAIIWCDQRTSEIVNRYSTPDYLEFFSKNTLNKLNTGFGLASLLWMRENQPQIFSKIASICLPKDYLRYKLTGFLGTEQTDASSLLAFDVENSNWSHEIFEEFNIDSSIFPKVFSPTEFAHPFQW